MNTYSTETFARVKSAYDLPRLSRSRIVAIGAGGAAQWLEDMARTGVGQFVIIDSDTVSETNLATQQVYRKDIGRSKVDCIAERLRDINPDAKILPIKQSLDDISDEQFSKLAQPGESIGQPAIQTLVCGLTDNFFAQARMARLSLNLGLPSLAAQLYHEGRGCEVTFTYPGVTPACHRCLLKSRYSSYENGFKNTVGSAGAPIFATARLNAIKGFIALALLHHGTEHTRWGGMLQRIATHNLVLTRMDPDIAQTLKMDGFDQVVQGPCNDYFFFDESIWIPKQPQANCPDCGGTGNLCEVIGKIPHSSL